MLSVRLLTVMLAALLLAGCARAPAKPPAPTPADPQAPRTDAPAPPAGTPLQVSPAPDALRRVSYPSTQAIEGPGLYIVDLATGKVESWTLANGQGQVRLSEDGRWAIAESGSQTYWADRTSGKVFGWNPNEVSLMNQTGDRFVFAKEGGTFYVTDAAFQVKSTFTLHLAAPEQAQFSTDGTRLALRAGSRIAVVDLASGQGRELAAPSTGQVVDAALLGPAGARLVVSYQLAGVQPTGLSSTQSLVRRYSWQGDLLGEFTLPGQATSLSPDGRLLLAEQDLSHLTSAVTVTTLATGQPSMRVAGARMPLWSADGSLIAFTGEDGPFYLVGGQGTLMMVPPNPVRDPIFMRRLLPAPNDPHRLLNGLTVLDDTGKVIQSITLPKRTDWLPFSSVWGRDASEVVLTIRSPAGKGNLGYDFPLAPELQKPPFPDPYLLQVTDPTGDCLYLRESPSRTSRALRCLPSGTRLAVADLQDSDKPQAKVFSDDQFWLWARTEQGETGWVSLSSGSLSWIR